MIWIRWANILRIKQRFLLVFWCLDYCTSNSASQDTVAPRPDLWIWWTFGIFSLLWSKILQTSLTPTPQVFRAGLPWRSQVISEMWTIGAVERNIRYPTFSVQTPWCSMMLSFLFEVLRRDPECTSVHADFFASAWRILQKHTNSFQSVRWFTDVWFVVRFQVGRDVVEGGRVAVRLESTASRGRDCQSVGAVKLVEELWRFKHKRS